MKKGNKTFCTAEKNMVSYYFLTTHTMMDFIMDISRLRKTEIMDNYGKTVMGLPQMVVIHLKKHLITLSKKH